MRRDEPKRHNRERETSHDRGGSYEDRGTDRHQHSRDREGERGSGHDRRGPEEEDYNRQRDVTPHHRNDLPDYRRGQLQGHSSGQFRDASSSPSEEEERYEPERRQAVYNLRYILTSRGLCQIMEVFVNLLIVICAGVPYSNSGVYRDLASLGGVYAYHFGGANAFTGADADRVKELDRLFNRLKLPPYVFSMACGGALMAYACVMLALGVLRVPYRWPPTLLGEALLNLLIGLGYVPALAFFFIKLQETYDSPVCKEREQLYKSKGHEGYGCQLHGADIAAGLFGVLGVVLFTFGAVLAVRAFRAVRERKKQRAAEDSNL